MWCISISVYMMYLYFSIYDVFLYLIGNGGQRALSGRALDLDWSFRLFPPALLSHNHFLDRRYRYIGFCWIFPFICQLSYFSLFWKVFFLQHSFHSITSLLTTRFYWFVSNIALNGLPSEIMSHYIYVLGKTSMKKNVFFQALPE